MANVERKELDSLARVAAHAKDLVGSAMPPMFKKDMRQISEQIEAALLIINEKYDLLSEYKAESDFGRRR